MRALERTQFEQVKLYKAALEEGRTLINDPAELADQIGNQIEIEVYFKELTEQLLAKVYVKGTEHITEASHLIPFWQIVKYSRQIPQPGDYFTLTCVVGIRRVYEDFFVIALRLPRE